MDDNTAIFLVHKGNQDWFRTSVEHLKHLSPNLRIILLGDDTNDHIKGIEHIYLNSMMSDEIMLFKNLYVHMSPNPLDYEILCFLRWFYIKNAMCALGINHVIYIDSDVLLNEITPTLYCSHENLLLCQGSWATTSFSLKTIDLFCSFIIDSFESKLSKVKHLYRSTENIIGHGVVSDMTILQIYICDKPFVDIGYLYDGHIFDGNINDLSLYIKNKFDRNEIDHSNIYDYSRVGQSFKTFSNMFEGTCGKKKILYNDGTFYFEDRQTGKPIIASSIHFQGSAKEFLCDVDRIRYADTGSRWMQFDYDIHKWKEGG